MRSWMIGMVAGIVPITILPHLPPPQLLGLLVALAVPLLFCGPVARLLAGCLLGLAWGSWHGHALLDQRLSPACNRQPMTVQGRVVSLPITRPGPGVNPRQRFAFQVDDWLAVERNRCGRPRDLLLSYYGEQRFLPGERWRLSVSLRYPWGLANQASHNRQAWLSQRGIDAVGTVARDGLQRLPGPAALGSAHHLLRYQLRQRIERAVADPDARAVLAALAVGDKSAISEDLWATLRLLGVNHLVVISGLHIGLAAATGFLLGTALNRLGGGRGSRSGVLLAMLIASAYALLAGMSLSTGRALLMLYCIGFSRLRQQRPTRWSGFLLALLVLLCWQPLAPLNSGFWLSFGAVAALLWLGQWCPAGSPWQRLSAAHAYLAIAMIPPGIAIFGGASLLTFAANLVLVPLVSLALVPAVLLCCLISLLNPGIDALCWQLVALPLQYLLHTAQHLPTWLAERGWWQTGASSLALALALLAVTLLVPAALRGLRPLLLLLCLPLLVASPPPVRPGNTEIHVFDVGQGTAVLLRRHDHALLYDTGGGDPSGGNIARSVLLPFLRDQGISRLDQLIVSHRDLDHSAGVATLVSGMAISEVWVGTPLPGRSADLLCAAGRSWLWRDAGGGSTARFRFLAPLPGETLESNNQSCVLQVDIDGYRLLLPGDIDARRERELVSYWGKELASDWLLVGHHGSNTSTSWAWLKAVAPQDAVLSHAYASAFGHPHPAVLERLRHRGVRTHSSADSGALRFTLGAGQPLRVRGWRAQQRRYWHGSDAAGTDRDRR